ncbi:hypothetical protein [Lacticaseibacillus brantae]|uniref:HIRAN domain-containing protein n=1 Tax=Lacticaseibacillus brantae DSM 23927 TaxID=1423727 RepID=A0A0R2AUV3_9LACO|nr:hypothetical protein [Lacticaseibacillus brantae]KRM71182.1 hypothetical protein FC34_GL001873 [Lacticaseibacillus brantae DSM 23927]
MAQPTLDDGLYVTITGMNHYFDLAPFDIGTYLLLQKDPTNVHDDEAIAAVLPVIGKVGYVANNTWTKARGTLSAGRLYNLVPEKSLAIVQFMLKDQLIARVFPEFAPTWEVGLKRNEAAINEDFFAELQARFKD